MMRYSHPSSPHVSGARWFVGDATIAFWLLNEARHRAVAALSGISKDWRSNLITVMAIGAVARAAHRAAAAPGKQVRKVRSSPTGVADTMIVAAVLREIFRSVAGPRPRAKPGAALIALVVVANSMRPTARGMLRAIRAVIVGVRRARAAISRYGVDANPDGIGDTRTG